MRNAMIPLSNQTILILVSILMLVSPVSQARACAGRMLRRPLKVAAFVFLCLFIVFLSSGFNMITAVKVAVLRDGWLLLALPRGRHAITALSAA